MEMSKPQEEEEKATDFLTPPTPLKTESAANSVKDLERRLQMMSQAEAKPAASKPAPPKAAPMAQPAATAAGGGKNALLARIMAAQNKTKAPTPATTTAAAPPMSFDPMGSAPPPPPPAFDATSLPAPQDSTSPSSSSAAPPPAFDDVFSAPPPATQPAAAAPSNLMWDPMAPAPDPTNNNSSNNTAEVPWTPQPPSAPSAPAFEDLLGFDQQHPPPMPPPQEQEAPSQQVGLDEETLQAILGMEGMSMAEKQAMIDEQERIMREIEEKNKPVSAADAFRQRSHAAAVQAIGGGGGGSSSQSSAAQRTVDIGNGHEVALKGQDQTQKAIQDGTAVLAQCLSCENWMQVTGNATLMFCPTCQTVSPVLKADDTEAAAQLKADMELAQRLQNEEYSAAEQRDQQRQRSSSSSPNKKKSSAASSSSWWDYLGFGSGATAATGVAAPAPSFAVKPPERGDMGVSRPPGSSGRRLETVQTGEEGGIGHSRSYEDDGPLLGGGGGGAAVVAPRQTSLFACVGDSITSAATQLTNALNTDEEGNVHGVDSSGLLAMPQVGRESNYRNMDDGRM